MVPEPATLTGRFVQLEPLAAAHLPGLLAAAADPRIWTWYPQRLDEPAALRAWVDEALAERAAGRALPFAILEAVSGAVAGSTRFGAMAPEHARVEIGWTWLHPRFQRTAVNTEAKRLLLGHAFETLGCVRVEFKTDALNAASRAALLRLGAQEEGTLRAHMKVQDGRLRDSVYYSILRDEWPAVRSRLDGFLNR